MFVFYVGLPHLLLHTWKCWRQRKLTSTAELVLASATGLLPSPTLVHRGPCVKIKIQLQKLLKIEKITPKFKGVIYIRNNVHFLSGFIFYLPHLFHTCKNVEGKDNSPPHLSWSLHKQQDGFHHWHWCRGSCVKRLYVGQLYSGGREECWHLHFSTRENVEGKINLE